MKFLFYVFEPVWEQGGTMVIHELSKILCDLGEDVYLTYTKTKLPENPSKIISQEEALQLACQDDCVTIYPEVVFGNPLQAKNVVRWVLFYPGGHGYGETVYHKDEFVFSYFDKYVSETIYQNAPSLLISQSRADKFYDMGKQRTKDAILIRKGRFINFDDMKIKYVDPYAKLLNKDIVIVDNFLNNVTGHEQLNEIFNEFRYFVSFDNTTYHSVLASLAGCVSVVVPVDNMTPEQWRNDNLTSRYGIAYGFDDLHWAVTTNHKVREHVLNVERGNINEAKNLIKLTKERWNIV